MYAKLRKTSIIIKIGPKYLHRLSAYNYFVIVLFVAISFVICVANRYKLNKNYIKLKAKSEAHPDDVAFKTRCKQAEVS